VEGVAGFTDQWQLGDEVDVSAGHEDVSTPPLNRPPHFCVHLRLERLGYPHFPGFPGGVDLAYPGVFSGTTHRLEDEPTVGPGVSFPTGQATQCIVTSAE
jgi:hypothetical protein